MKYMTSLQIRNMWLDFFKEKGHEIIESASLIPVNDPTLLWINAGVAPLKKYFDGSEIPNSPRMTNVQKCIRTNDIENVGKTARHHTFFEMLGNFSIANYFRDTAIEYGFELLTSAKYFNFPLEKLVFTYYPTDIETRDKWIECGVPASQLVASIHNFWEIGEGPCGPNTEIFFDRGNDYGEGGLELISEDIENDRYVEIWNIVFSQYNSKTGLNRNEYPELPNRNIDTGAGLERFASVIQNTKTNFETDLFLPIIKAIEELSGLIYNDQMAFKVIADHIKTLVFAIADGAMLSNEGRGYVLRRILRRAVKHGRDLGFSKPFLHLLIDSVIITMADFYPYLESRKEIISKIILREEKQFLETIAEGEKHLLEMIDPNKLEISGRTAFKLYDTYGFPIELTLEYAEENNVKVNMEEFNEALEEQKARSRGARENISSMKVQEEQYLTFTLDSTFVGYNKTAVETEVIAVFDEGIVLKETPFYAMSGGQVSDRGSINEVEVLDVKKLPNKQHLHLLDSSQFKTGDVVYASVNKKSRLHTEQNHTATHILHQALKDVLGNHVVQQGSQVNDETLRFDFNHYEAITNDDLLKIEQIVKDKITTPLEVTIKEMNINDAKKLGAMALFGEKYGNTVRVVNMGYSIELCGGTHVSNTLEIGDFAIIAFESIGSGMYRIEATTNGLIIKAINKSTVHIAEELEQLNIKGVKLKGSDFKLLKLTNNTNSYQDILNARIKLEEARQLIHTLERADSQEKALDVLKNANQFIPKDAQSKLVIKTENIDIPILKQLVDVLYDKIKAETLLVINTNSDSATFIAKTDGKTHAGKLIQAFAKLTNGSGGGRDTLAQGGTKDLSLLTDAINKIKAQL